MSYRIVGNAVIATVRLDALIAELAAFRAFLTERGCGGVGDANGMHDLAQRHEELIADSERQAARIARLEAALQRLVQWAGAYPPSAFPPMTAGWAKRANAVLVDHGMTIDRISADAMRHVIEGVGKIAAAALTDAPEEEP